MLDKYRSAVYTFSDLAIEDVQGLIRQYQEEFEKPIITQVLPLLHFKLNKEQYQDYYRKNPDSQFCQTYIKPKFKLLFKKYSNLVELIA